MKKPKIILVIAISLDGRIAFPEGGESHLGSKHDKNLLNKSLNNIDATLLGSGTLKAHKCNYLFKKRNFFGKIKQISKKQPISIVVGNCNNFSKDWLFFRQPLKRWLISSVENIEKSKVNFDKIFYFQNSWNHVLDLLHQEGIKKIALLGGAKLIYSFAKEDLIDEIKITICPRIVGGKFVWIPFEEKNEIYNFDNIWETKKIKVLKSNEIFIHYTKKSNNFKDK